MRRVGRLHAITDETLQSASLTASWLGFYESPEQRLSIISIDCFDQAGGRGGQKTLAQQLGLRIGLAAADQQLKLVERLAFESGGLGAPRGQAAVFADEPLELGAAAAAAFTGLRVRHTAGL